MECKVNDDDPCYQSHTDLVPMAPKSVPICLQSVPISPKSVPISSQSVPISPLTSQSVSSLPSINPVSAVESWLATLDQWECSDTSSVEYDTPDTSTVEYDTPYSETLTSTRIPGIFIRTITEPVYQNLTQSNKSGSKAMTSESRRTSPTTPNVVNTPTNCTKNTCIADKHYACTDILKLHNLNTTTNKLNSKFAKSEEIIKSYSTPSTSPRSSSLHYSKPQEHKRMCSVDSGLASDVSVARSFQDKLNFFNTNRFSGSGSIENVINSTSHIRNERPSF